MNEVTRLSVKALGELREMLIDRALDANYFRDRCAENEYLDSKVKLCGVIDSMKRSGVQFIDATDLARQIDCQRFNNAGNEYMWESYLCLEG